MRTLVALTIACLIFVACSSNPDENSAPVADASADTGSRPGPGGQDAAATTDSASPPADTSTPIEDSMTPSPDDAASAMDGDDTGVDDAPAGIDATSPLDSGQATGDAGDAGNWKLVCPNSMPPMTCCTMYCGCMQQRCATEIAGGFPGGKDCMTWCLTVGPTLMRGPVSTGIQFLVCECSEAGNPAVPQDWHSHCGHALGMNGGTCKY
jgi:hypothetical protein